MREIAAAVDADPALAIRHFGSKELGHVAILIGTTAVTAPPGPNRLTTKLTMLRALTADPLGRTRPTGRKESGAATSNRRASAGAHPRSVLSCSTAR